MEVYGLIGDPVAHSRSPALFDAAFDAVGVDARYVLFPVDAESVGTAVAGAHALGIAGLNVTIPHKEAVLPHCDQSPAVETIGAANVLTFDATPPTAANTDATAMTAVLEDLGRPAGRALLLGAGGAARAYAYALDAAGWDLDIANRTETTAAEVASLYDDARPHRLGAAEVLAAEADLVVNATPVGMAGQDWPLSPDALVPDHTVIDAAYRPGGTPLVRAARERGCETVRGEVLLLEQAAAAFDRWRDESPPLDAMRGAIERAIGR